MNARRRYTLVENKRHQECWKRIIAVSIEKKVFILVYTEKKSVYTVLGWIDQKAIIYLLNSNHYNIFYLTHRLNFSVRVYCNRSQMTSQRVKNKKYDTRRSRVV